MKNIFILCIFLLFVSTACANSQTQLVEENEIVTVANEEQVKNAVEEEKQEDEVVSLKLIGMT